MSVMHTETYKAFMAANVPQQHAENAAIAVAGDQNMIMDKLNQMREETADKFNKMEDSFAKLEKDIREDIHSLDKKFLIITTVMSTALPIIGGMLVFVLRAIG
jgi:SepF-like predicted cell division protein (DUF552 family)